MIGIFDSGFGGLGVVREILNEVPGHEFVFFADTKNFPYGSRKKEDLRDLALYNFKFLKDKGADAVVVACNTISSLLDDDMREEVGLPIIDVVSSGLKLIDSDKMDKIGLIATQSSINQGVLQDGIKARGVGLEAHEAQDLVALAQERSFGPKAEERVDRALDFFRDKGLDGLYLGCTHYSLIKDMIYKSLRLDLIDPAKRTALDLKDLVGTSRGVSELEFISSSEIEKNRAIAVEILGHSQVVVK